MFWKAAAVLVGAVLLAGCAAPQESPSRQSPPPSPTVAARNEFLWHVVDGNGNRVRDLPDDDPAVAAVRKVVVLHSGVVDNRSAATVAGSVADEFAYYYPDFVTALRSQGYDGKLVDLFTTNRLATRQLSVAWYESTFSESMTTATAQFESTFEFTAAAPGYLGANQFALNQPYSQRRTVSLTRDGDTWRIARIEKDGLTRTVPPGR